MLGVVLPWMEAGNAASSATVPSCATVQLRSGLGVILPRTTAMTMDSAMNTGDGEPVTLARRDPSRETFLLKIQNTTGGAAAGAQRGASGDTIADSYFGQLPAPNRVCDCSTNQLDVSERRRSRSGSSTKKPSRRLSEAASIWVSAGGGARSTTARVLLDVHRHGGRSVQRCARPLAHSM